MKAPKKTTSLEQAAQVLALRAAGFTALVISERLGISVRTLHSIFAAHGAKKGANKEEPLSMVTSNAAIKAAAARLIHDDLAHAAYLRSVLFEAAEHLKATNLRDAALVIRAVAAYSTALKNTTAMTRHVFRLDDIDDGEDELPVLKIVGLTPEGIEDLRAGQRHEQPAAEPENEHASIDVCDGSVATSIK